MKVNPKKYFEKHGYIYGDSYAFAFGIWSHNVRKFTNYEDAVLWLRQEEFGFRTREFITKTEAIKLGYTEKEVN